MKEPVSFTIVAPALRLVAISWTGPAMVDAPPGTDADDLLCGHLL